jgi:hypothetical protein
MSDLSGQVYFRETMTQDNEALSKFLYRKDRVLLYIRSVIKITFPISSLIPMHDFYCEFLRKNYSTNTGLGGLNLEVYRLEALCFSYITCRQGTSRI